MMTSPTRPDLPDQVLRLLIAGLCLALITYFVFKSDLPAIWQRPGSPLLQSAATAGALFLLAPYLFSLGKRGGLSEIPNRLFILHVGASIAGMFLVALHAIASLKGPPLILIGLLALLLLTGALARLYLGFSMAATFGSKPRAFAPADAAIKAELGDIIRRKAELLIRLDPAANEAVFSVTLRHLCRAPYLSIAYMRLARRESAIIGARASVHWVQAWWRPLHLTLAWVFLAGLVLHVVVVTFFAGYAAGGRDIYWWHLAAW